MKNFFLLSILTFALSLNAQNIRVYNLNVAPNNAASVADLFDEYHSKGKRKSGNVILQRVQFQNNVTHRVLLTGDPNNWGSAIERPNSEWRAYLRGTRAFRRPTEGSYTATSAYWKAGERKKYNYGQQWLLKVKDPAKYASAWIKFAKAIEPMIGDRMIGLGSISMGDLGGATHYTVFYGESMNDLEVMIGKIRKSNAYQEYVKNRGEMEIIKSFAVQDLLVYN
mgnify:FL=1|tara:strand:- start:1225 stop:1896 length:672 start_codon:yes stop_codon:yes gene_type:complete